MKKLPVSFSNVSFLSKTFFVALFLFALSPFSRILGQIDSATFTASGATTWMAPPGVTSVTIRTWGGGGGGGSISAAAASRGGGGGGGGGYSQGTFAVTPGNTYNIVVGAGGLGVAAGAGTTGGESYFNSAATVRANGGAGGGEGTGGNGGGGAGAGGLAGIGTLTRTGGNGAAGLNGTRGGAGGGGAGTSGNGGNAVTITFGAGTSYGGGNGAAGRITTGIGNGGTTYGGGGGGSYKTGTVVTDAGGAGASGAVTVLWTPAILTINSITMTNVNCNGGSNGTATANVGGGTSPYTYLWNDANSQTTATAIGLVPGTYTVTVTDNVGAIVSGSTTINQPNALSLSTTVLANVNCNGANDGRVNVSPSGGTIPYTYSWNDINNQTTATATGLIAGEYTITVSDSCGASVSAQAIITQPDVIMVSTNVVNVSCGGGSTGSASVSLTGGSTPYTYLWSDANSQTTATANGLSIGTYSVSVVDNTACGVTAAVTITQPGAISAGINTTDVTCNGLSNGDASISAGGGLAPYTYSWSNGNTTSSINNVISGVYTITVTDNCGTVYTTTVNINQPAVLTSTPYLVTVSCAGVATASANPAGGTAPYTYSWNGGQTTDTITGLSAGTYSVSVVDINGCSTSTGSVVFTGTSVLTLSTTVLANVTCNNGNNGRVTVSLSGGATPYTYLWNDPNSQTTATATALQSGAYTVTVTDNCGVTATADAIVTQPTALLGSTSIGSNINCTGGNNGSASASGSGGTPPYTYSWSDGQATSGATGLIAGTYTVTITDNNLCVIGLTATITQPAVLTITPIVTGVSCYGLSNGSILASLNSGTAPYTYLWSDANSQTTATVTGLSIGTYSVTVTDGCGSTATANATMTQPDTLTVSTNAIGNVTCNGGNNGSSLASPSGGTAPYTYLWNDAGSQTNATATGLAAGTYTVFVTDSHGCSNSATAVITEPTVLSATTTVSNVTCNGLVNGRSSAFPSGGAAPFTYQWNDANLQTTETATGLSTGSYTVTVMDACGASTTASAVITQPTVLGSSAGVLTNVTCTNGADGSVFAAPTGGTAPYTYLWSNGETGVDATGLSAGSYSVTVTDNNGCTASAGTSTTQPAAFGFSVSVTTQVGCSGAATGIATAAPSGGTIPYTYLWNDAASQTTVSASGLSAGTYTVTVSDACGTSATGSVTLTQPGPLSVSLTVTGNVTCNGGANGTAAANTSGGTSPYTYSWGPGNLHTISTVTGLSVGTYTVLVTDRCGNTATAACTVTQPGILTALANTTTNVTCYEGANGSATASERGGTAPYTYLWNDVNSETTATATALPAGSYTVTVTDNCGGTSTASVTITQPIALSASASVVTVSCAGLGTALASPSGGTAPYTYLWNDGGSQATATATGLSAGNYTVSVTDNCGASVTSPITISVPDALTTSASTVSNVGCNGGATGSVSTSPSGGFLPYTYLWTGPGSQITSTATGLVSGTYTVTVTDNCGNTATASAVVGQPNILTSSAIVNNVTCNGGNNGNASASPSGGSVPYTYSWSNGQTNVTATSLIAGTYTVTVSDVCGDVTTALAIITQPGAMSPSTTVTNVACLGGATGSATANPGGGTAPYTYLWNDANSQNTASATGLAPGTYTVTITDNCGASVTTSAIITQPGVLSASPVVTNISCNGLINGSILASLTGGAAPFTYLWNDAASQTTATATGLSVGTYSVVVNDACGNSATTSAAISQPDVLTSLSAETNVNCFGDNSGTGTASPSGGTAPYTYLWSDGNSQVTATASNLSAGTYSVSITDNNGCSTSTSVTLTQPASALGITIASSTNVTCNTLGTITANAATGGTSPYTYSWSGGAGTNLSISSLSSGTYVITVTDSSGCTATASAIVTQPAASLGVTISSVTNVLCNGGTGSITANAATGGTSPYTYLWSDASSQTSLTAAGLSAGIYSITVTDNNGCIAVTSVTVTQPASALSVSIASVTNASCNAGLGAAKANAAAGGTAPYTYAWTPSGGTGLTATALPAGSYTITATDNNGCTATAIAVITQPTSLAITTSSVNSIACYGGRGSISADSATGGTEPYTYHWTPSGGTNLTASNLVAGTYTITVTDNHGCTANVSATITTPANAVAISMSSHTSISCNGGSNGSATAFSATGGTSPYNYSWSPSGGNNLTASNLSAGIYTIVVTDNNGCTASANVNITQPASALGTSITTQTDVSCFGGNNGKATAHSGTGGTAPYVYSWSPSGGNGLTATGLSAGVYTVTVQDNNGCTTTAAATITQPAAAVSLTTSVDNILCYGDRGTATANVAGGTSPYTYRWTGGAGSNATATNLGAGTYTITTTDNNGCTESATVTITSPSAAITITSSSGTTSSDTTCNGVASVSVLGGGTAPFTYQWLTGGQTTARITGQCAGDYCVIVTDANGCSKSACVNVGITGVQNISNSISVNIYPNPNTGKFTIAGIERGMIVEVYDYIGRKVSAISATNETMQVNISTEPNGIYLIRITDKNGVPLDQKKIVKVK